jgi:hypothetical protein
MSKRIRSNEERLRFERLGREALESRPAFSESLHQHILRVVRQHHATAANLVVGPAVSRRWPRVLASALTAACLLAAVAIGWRLMENASRQSRIEKIRSLAGPTLNKLPSIGDLTDHTVGKLDQLTVSAALEPQTTPLKHDARAVAGIFLDRLPVNLTVVDNR